MNRLKELSINPHINECCICHITNEQIQKHQLQSSFGCVQIEKIDRYLLPVCDYCSTAIKGLGAYILAREYENELQKPYTLPKMINKFTERCETNGFFHRMCVFRMEKFLHQVDKLVEEYKPTSHTVEPFRKRMYHLAESLNKVDEYVHITIAPTEIYINEEGDKIPYVTIITSGIIPGKEENKPMLYSKLMFSA